MAESMVILRHIVQVTTTAVWLYVIASFSQSLCRIFGGWSPMGRKRTLAANIIRLRVYLKQTDWATPGHYVKFPFMHSNFVSNGL